MRWLMGLLQRSALKSRPCENAEAINRDRTSYSFKAFSCTHVASAFNFKIEIKNINLVTLRTLEFSRSLGHFRPRQASNRSDHVRYPLTAEASSEPEPLRH